MKNLRMLIALSVLFGAMSVTDSYAKEQSEQQSEKKVKKQKNAKKQSKQPNERKQYEKSCRKKEKCRKEMIAGNDSMKQIECDLHQVRHKFDQSGNREQAMAKLESIQVRIEQLVTRMKQSEEHGKMWEIHEHTLNRKLDALRKYIEKQSQR